MNTVSKNGLKWGNFPVKESPRRAGSLVEGRRAMKERLSENSVAPRRFRRVTSLDGSQRAVGLRSGNGLGPPEQPRPVIRGAAGLDICPEPWAGRSPVVSRPQDTPRETKSQRGFDDAPTVDIRSCMVLGVRDSHTWHRRSGRLICDSRLPSSFLTPGPWRSKKDFRGRRSSRGSFDRKRQFRTAADPI
jgi:hypothetical protein